MRRMLWGWNFNLDVTWGKSKYAFFAKMFLFADELDIAAKIHVTVSQILIFLFVVTLYRVSYVFEYNYNLY